LPPKPLQSASNLFLTASRHDLDYTKERMAKDRSPPAKYSPNFEVTKPGSVCQKLSPSPRLFPDLKPRISPFKADLREDFWDKREIPEAY